MKQILVSLIFVFSCLSLCAQRKIVVRDAGSLLPISNARIVFDDGNKALTNAKGECIVPSTKKVATVWGNHYWEKNAKYETLGAAILLQPVKNRVVVTTDMGSYEPDDHQSLIHLLSCANIIDIEGIISNLAWDHRCQYLSSIQNVLDIYGKVVNKFRLHGDNYPSAEYLHSITRYGQSFPGMKGIGENKDTEGSELIISIVDKEDDVRPVWLTAWGGMGTIAQAIWKVSQTRTQEEINRFLNKIRIYDILGQDDCGAWIAKTFPQITYIRAKNVYGWEPENSWLAINIMSQGEFGKDYPAKVWATEGDSPAFLYLLSNGLNAPEHLDWGSWGSRFSQTKTEGIRGMQFVAKEGQHEEYFDPYFMHTETEEGIEAINLWQTHILNDFSGRMRWSNSDSYNDCNHHPLVALNGDISPQYLDFYGSAGQTISLDASGSTDPDGDELKYEWMYYKEPSKYSGELSMNVNGTKCEITIPTGKSGDTIHIILIVTDNGNPALTSYRRAVITIK